MKEEKKMRAKMGEFNCLLFVLIRERGSKLQ